jgi:hypothetical protein
MFGSMSRNVILPTSTSTPNVTDCKPSILRRPFLIPRDSSLFAYAHKSSIFHQNYPILHEPLSPQISPHRAMPNRISALLKRKRKPQPAIVEMPTTDIDALNAQQKELERPSYQLVNREDETVIQADAKGVYTCGGVEFVTPNYGGGEDASGKDDAGGNVGGANGVDGGDGGGKSRDESWSGLEGEDR